VEFNTSPLNEAELRARQRQRAANHIGWQAIRNYAVIIVTAIICTAVFHEVMLPVMTGLIFIVGTLTATLIRLHYLDRELKDDD